MKNKKFTDTFADEIEEHIMELERAWAEDTKNKTEAEIQELEPVRNKIRQLGNKLKELKQLVTAKP